MTVTGSPFLAEDEISLRDLLASLWWGRWIASGLTIGFGLLAFVAAQIAPKDYRVAVQMAVVTDSVGAGGPLNAISSQLGGLAALAGLSGSGDSRRAEAVALLESQSLAADFVTRYELLPVLLEGRWDSSAGRWKASDPQEIPTIWDGSNYFRSKIRTVQTDAKTGLVQLGISWRDPDMAARWANDYVQMANEALRAKAIAEAERNIAYLNAQAEKTNVVELRQAIYGLLQTEINKSMLARGNEEFAFRVIDKAVPPRRPTSPILELWVAAGLLAGFVLSALTVFVRSAVVRQRQNSGAAGLAPKR